MTPDAVATSSGRSKAPLTASPLSLGTAPAGRGKPGGRASQMRPHSTVDCVGRRFGDAETDPAAEGALVAGCDDVAGADPLGEPPGGEG
jgi:hypothetical protein